eukprot:scaffold8191_cov132-Isochrysis_galbana.AAC.2
MRDTLPMADGQEINQVGPRLRSATRATVSARNGRSGRRQPKTVNARGNTSTGSTWRVLIFR